MSKLILDGWKITSLNEKVNFLSGFPFKSALFVEDKTKIGLIRIRDIQKQELRTHYSGEYDDTYIVKKGDVLIGMDGDFNITKWRIKDALLNQRICKVTAIDGSGFDTNFLYYFLAPELLLINEKTVATTVKHLSVKDLREITKPFPPLPEQQKIAKILTSVDNVIEKTQSQIDKLKDLKTGMMQELLTNGIGHTEFKDSPVGRIPVEWDVVTLGDITIESAFGPRFSSDEYASNGNFGCIRTTDMDDSWDINYSTAPLARLCYEEFKKHILVDGDLLVTRSGTCGLVDVFREQPIPMIAAAFLIRFRLNENMNPFFVKYLMMSATIQEKVQLLASGGVQQNLSGTSLKTLKIPKPSIKEQKKIIRVIESINNRLADTKKKLSLNIKLKKALMQDLLTGKVRVKVDSELQ